MSRYDGADFYVYPDSHVLCNKQDIRNQTDLDAFEADVTALRMLELVEHPVQGIFDLKHLCEIHGYLFQDVYDWAGKLRLIDISREGSRFANFTKIESYLDKKLRGLAAENYLRGLAPKSFVTRLAHYMAEINAAHPFRDGNGRVQRFFCAQLAEQAGYFIDFETVNQAEMYAVMIDSFNGDEKPLAALLERIISIVE